MNDPVAITDSCSPSVGRGGNHEDAVAVTGRVLVELFDAAGSLKDARRVDNLVVTRGKQHIADQLSSAPNDAAMGWMAVGTRSPKLLR